MPNDYFIIILHLFRMTSKGGKVGLDILEVSTSDAGQYALITSNKQGEAKAAFSLNV